MNNQQEINNIFFFNTYSVMNTKWKEKSQFIGQLEKQVQQIKSTWENKEKKITEERDKALDAAR